MKHSFQLATYRWFNGKQTYWKCHSTQNHFQTIWMVKEDKMGILQREMNVNETKVNLRPLKTTKRASITTNQPRVTKEDICQIGVLAEGPVGRKSASIPKYPSAIRTEPRECSAPWSGYKNSKENQWLKVQVQRNEHRLFIHASSSFSPLPSAGSLPGGKAPQNHNDQTRQGIISLLFDGET